MSKNAKYQLKRAEEQRMILCYVLVKERHNSLIIYQANFYKGKNKQLVSCYFITHFKKLNVMSSII